MASRDMAGGPKGGVFISYARADGEEFATRLRLRLEAAGVSPVWQDRERMYGGHDWWLQIEGALKQVEFLVLVITPHSVESRMVRKEWRFGLREGVCVFGVEGSEDAPLGALPGWMNSRHIYSLGTLEEGAEAPEWDKFVADLRAPCRQPRVPFMAADLPPGHVPREAELRKLKASLLDPAREDAVAITAALSGAGGFGKTTLAQALCHDDDVQTFFHGGVLWTTLGERPGDLTRYVNELIESLGDQRPGFVTIDAAVARLRELLADRTLLLVVDDVWNAAHLKPFTQGGPRCTRLITTRVLDAAPPRAVKIVVDAMRLEEAVSLLRFDLPGGFDAELKELASALGEWPLLLRLANGVLRYRVNDRGQPPADALRFVADDLRENGLVAFDAEDPEARDQAVAATIGVSVGLLKEDERERFDALAVFPEDADVPLATLRRLWGLSDLNTEKLCERLHRLSLLQGFDPNARRIRLHDVIRKYLVHEQGDRMAARQSRLLEAHRPPPPAGAQASAADWAALPADEPYLWERLSYHLVGAGLEEELHGLLSSETPEGRNAWYEAKAEARGVAPYLADVNDALGLAAEESRRSLLGGGAAAGLAREARYHFIRASVNSLSFNIPPPLLAAVAARRVMPAPKIMAQVQSLPQGSLAQGYRKNYAAGAVSKHFDEPLKSDFLRVMLAVAREAADEDARANYIGQFSQWVTEPLLNELLKLIREVKSPELFQRLIAIAAAVHARLGRADEGFALFAELEPSARRLAIDEMSPHLNAAQARRAADIAEELGGRERDLALRAAASRLAELGEAEAALGLAERIEDPAAKGDAFCAAARFLAGEEAEKALGLAEGLQDLPRRVEAMARLAHGLPEPRRSQLFTRLLDEVEGRYEKDALYAQERLMRLLPKEFILDEKFSMFLTLSLSEDDPQEREILNALCGRLAELGCFDEAFKMIVRDTDSDYVRAERLELVAPYLDAAHLEQALDIASRLDGQYQYRRESALTHLLRRKAQLGGAREALAQALGLEEEKLRERVIEAAAEHLDGDGLRFALKSQQKIDDAQAHLDCGLLMAAYAPAALLPEVLDVLEDGTSEVVQELSLVRMGRRLPPDALEEVYEGVGLITNPLARARARLTLAPFLDDAERAVVVEDTLASKWPLGDTGRVLESLWGLLPRLDAALGARVRAFMSDEIWGLVRKEDGSIRSPGLLAHFVTLLAELGETGEALAAARAVRDDTRQRLVALARLEPHLAPAERAEVFAELVESIEQEDNPYSTVVTFGQPARQLSPELLRAVLRVLTERCDPQHIVSEIERFAVRLAEVGEAEGALALAHRIPRARGYELARALAGVAKHLPEQQREQALSDALEAACRVVNPVNLASGRPDWRARLLAGLAEQLEELPPQSLYRLWRNASRALSNNPREEFLYDAGALAPVLERLGGEGAVEDVWFAALAAARWWP